ncbi:MAG: 50S ribosomal protein L21 [Oligoflexia bacterium]|nr:50S ribosomal protein L21 [Oligoflexia bacterium]
MIYAVVKAGGRQYRVVPGQTFSVEKIEGAPGSSVELNEVLMVGGDAPVVGSPLVSGAKIKAVVESQYRGTKVLVFKKKRRHKYRKMKGHRSELTRLFVAEIVSPKGSYKADNEPRIDSEEKRAQKLERKEKARLQAADTQEASGTKKAKKPAAKAKKTGAKKKASTKKKK